MDEFGRLAWGLVKIDDATVYWEQCESGYRAKEFGVVGPFHPVSESINKRIWGVIQEDIQHRSDKT